MKGTGNLKNVAERLDEAQQLLRLAIEKGSIASIDRDLVLEKLRKAYDTLLFEGEPEKQVVVAPPVVAPVKVKVEKVREVPVKQPIPEVKPQLATFAETKQTISVKNSVPENNIVHEAPNMPEMTAEDETLDIEIEETTQEQPQSQSILSVHQTESLAEKFQGKRKFMTDSLSKQIQEKPVAAKLQDKPIKDLTKEIGVHDKFLFIKELFKGDNQLYDLTLKKVNQFTDINEALIYIQENFTWDQNSKAAIKFIDLIRRKLLSE